MEGGKVLFHNDAVTIINIMTDVSSGGNAEVRDVIAICESAVADMAD